MARCPILGTRGSALALVQAHKVASALEVAHRWAADDVKIVTITTSGDKVRDRPLADAGGKALWTREIDQALLDETIDFAVHSLKDVEAERPRAIRIAAVRPRVDVRDRIVGADSIEALAKGATVGTSSPRRAAQLRALRSDLTIVPIRGNVDTRLAKLEAGEVDALILAAAGLIRLGKPDSGTAIPVEVMLPAPAQAVIAMECRAKDAVTAGALKLVDHAPTHIAVDAERAFTRTLKATCHSPVAALATVEDGRLWLRAELLAEDGSGKIADEIRFDCGDQDAPRQLAERMLANAPDAIRRLFSGA